MIRVVDMPMGSGKTESAISFMNEHPDRLYLYVTPFLKETERIVRSCSSLNFTEPSNKIPAYDHRKRSHLPALVRQGRNIAMTHSLFCTIDNRTARLIMEKQYIIIIDEVIDVFEQVSESEADLELLVSGGYLERNRDGECDYLTPTDRVEDYSGRFNELFDKAGYGQIVQIGGWTGDGVGRYGIWLVNSSLFKLSSEIYILTYMFPGSHMCAFLDSHAFEYTYIGTRKCEDGRFRFAERGELPAYLGHLRDMVHLCEKDSINNIGDESSAFSVGWLAKAREDGRLRVVSNHIHAFFRRHVPEWVGADDRLWSTFSEYEKEVGGHGFQRSFLAYNTKSVNEFGSRSALAYCVNIYPHPSMKSYLTHIGVQLDWEKYAVSCMVQWIWRSRIRNGQEIWVYIPSRRMRTLFVQWMEGAEAAYWKEVSDRRHGTTDYQGRLVTDHH